MQVLVPDMVFDDVVQICCVDMARSGEGELVPGGSAEEWRAHRAGLVGAVSSACGVVCSRRGVVWASKRRLRTTGCRDRRSGLSCMLSNRRVEREREQIPWEWSRGLSQGVWLMCGTSGENCVHQDELGCGPLRNLGVLGWLAGLGG